MTNRELEVMRFNAQNIKVEGSNLCRLSHGEECGMFFRYDYEPRYRAYQEFAEQTIDKSLSADQTNIHNSGIVKEATIVYTPYGPILKSVKTSTEDKTVDYEGMFKFDVDGAEKLLYTKISVTNDALNEAVVRRENGEFERYPELSSQEIKNFLKVENYFSEVLKEVQQQAKE